LIQDLGVEMKVTVWHPFDVSDTSIEADAVRVNVLQRLSPSRRFAMATGWSTSMREMVRAGIKRQFAEAPESVRRRLLAERWLGAELAAKVYGPIDPNG
jgi:hypothetical protein